LRGSCGSDPIRILAGVDFLNPVSSTEADTLEDICDLEPGKYRMACVARPTGPVEVEMIS
jgi:ferredoxin